jgi:hypothetical protein
VIEELLVGVFGFGLLLLFLLLLASAFCYRASGVAGRCIGPLRWSFARASAMRYLASCVAPVRGGTYFSLPPQRKVGKRKRLTPPALILA